MRLRIAGSWPSSCVACALAIVLCLALLVAASGASAASSEAAASEAVEATGDTLFSMEVVGEHAARLNEIVVADSNAYLATGSRIKVLDVSDASNVYVAHQTDVFAVPSRGLAVAGQYLVSSGLDAAGAVFVLSDAPQLRQVGTLGLAEPPAALCTDDATAYVFTHRELRSVSLSPPTFLQTVAQAPTEDIYPEMCAAGRGYLYAVTYDELLVIDLALPNAPATAGRMPWPDALWQPTGIAVDSASGLLLVAGLTPPPDEVPPPTFATPQPFLRLFDVTTPNSPIQVGMLASGPPGLSRYEGGGAVAVRGDLAYVTNVRGGLWIIDVSQPSHPVVVADHDVGTSPAALAISPADGSHRPTHAFVADDHTGIASVDVSDPERPALLGWLETPTWNVNDVEAAWQYAYVADFDAGVRIVDLTDPSWSRDIATIPVDYPLDIVLSEDETPSTPHRAFVLAPGFLRVFDVSDVREPREIGALSLEGTPSKLAASGPSLYVRDSSALVQVIDVSNQRAPRMAGSVSGRTCPGVEMVAWRGFVYVLCRDASSESGGSIEVVDATDPDSPVHVRSFPAKPPLASPSKPFWLAVGDGHLYVMRIYGPQFHPAVDVYDLARLDSPRFVGGLHVGGSALAMTVSDSVAYVTLNTGLIQALDVTDPVRARKLAEVRTPSRRTARFIATAADLVLSGGEGSLGITRVRPTGWPIFLPTLRRAPTATHHVDPRTSSSLSPGKR